MAGRLTAGRRKPPPILRKRSGGWPTAGQNKDKICPTKVTRHRFARRRRACLLGAPAGLLPTTLPPFLARPAVRPPGGRVALSRRAATSWQVHCVKLCRLSDLMCVRHLSAGRPYFGRSIGRSVGRSAARRSKSGWSLSDLHAHRPAKRLPIQRPACRPPRL